MSIRVFIYIWICAVLHGVLHRTDLFASSKLFAQGKDTPDIDKPVFLGRKTIGNCSECVIVIAGLSRLIRCYAVGIKVPYRMEMYIGSKRIFHWSLSDYNYNVMHKATLDDHYKNVTCEAYYNSQDEPMVTTTMMFVTVMPSRTQPVLTFTSQEDSLPSAVCSTPGAFRPPANLTITIFNEKNSSIATWKNVSGDVSISNTELYIKTIRRKWFGDTIKCCLQHFMIRMSNDLDTVCIEDLLNFTNNAKDKDPVINDTVVINHNNTETTSAVDILPIVLPVVAVVLTLCATITTCVFMKKRKQKQNLLDFQESHDIRMSAELIRESSVYTSNAPQTFGTFGCSVYNSAPPTITRRSSDNESAKYEPMQSNSQARLFNVNLTDIPNNRNTIAVHSYEALDRSRGADHKYATLNPDNRYSYIYMTGAKSEASGLDRPAYEALDKSAIGMNTYAQLSPKNQQPYVERDMFNHRDDSRRPSASVYEALDKSTINIKNTYDSLQIQGGRFSYVNVPTYSRPIRGAVSAGDALDRISRIDNHAYEPIQTSIRDYVNLKDREKL